MNFLKLPALGEKKMKNDKEEYFFIKKDMKNTFKYRFPKQIHKNYVFFLIKFREKEEGN